MTIGVALPLSGKLRAFGESGRDAVRLAAGELDKEDRQIRIALRDTRGESAGAAKAVEELVLQDGAVAVVGPLFRSEATAAAEKAQELGVPLIALTGDRDVSDAGGYVFHAGLAPEDEMEALVSYAMDDLGLTRFAVLHPQIEYGERMLKLFRERVEDKGGTIVGVESYEAKATTFTKPIRRLVQRDEPSNRPDYRRLVARCKDAPDSYRKARCEKEAQEKIPPIIEFEGLFIPDGHRKVALIAPAVAAEDIVVARDPRVLEKIERTLGREVHPITLLGTSAWSSPGLGKKAGRAVENAIFADVSFGDAGDDVARAFKAVFRRRFQRSPKRHEALLYDATRFIRAALTTAPPASTDDLRAALHQVQGFRGATGEISFEHGTEAERRFEILTFENGAIRKKQAPRRM